MDKNTNCKEASVTKDLKELCKDISALELERDRLLKIACIYIFVYDRRNLKRTRLAVDYSAAFKDNYPAVYAEVLRGQILDLNLTIACRKYAFGGITPM